MCLLCHLLSVFVRRLILIISKKYARVWRVIRKRRLSFISASNSVHSTEVGWCVQSMTLVCAVIVIIVLIRVRFRVVGIKCVLYVWVTCWVRFTRMVMVCMMLILGWWFITVWWRTVDVTVGIDMRCVVIGWVRLFIAKSKNHWNLEENFSKLEKSSRMMLMIRWLGWRLVAFFHCNPCTV